MNRTTEVILEKLRFGLQDYMSSVLLEEIEYERIVNFHNDSIIQQIRGWVYSRKVHEDVYTECLGTIKYPRDWKEAIKDRWFPKWLKKRFAVKYNTHEVNISTTIKLIKTCPHLNIKTQEPHINFLAKDFEH